MRKLRFVLLTAACCALLAAPLFAAEDCIPLDPNKVEAKLVNGNWTVPTPAIPPVHVTGTVWPQNLPSQGLQDNAWSGVQGHHLQQFKMSVVETNAGVSLSYKCTIEGKGETPWMSQGQTCGTAGGNIVGFAIQLSGPQAPNYDVFYQGRGGRLDSVVLLNGAPCLFQGIMVIQMGGTRQIDAMKVWISPKVKAANYTFRITSVTINHTRSHNTDTNHSSVSVFRNNAQIARAVSHEGDRADGTYHPTVLVANVEIPRTSSVRVVNTVLNIGGSQGEADAVIQTVLNQVADYAVASVAAEAGPLVLEGIDWVIGKVIDGISNIFHHLCDGLVWADGRTLGGEWLFQNTTGGRVVTFTKTFPGLNSPQGCGNNSLYSATWTVSRQ